MTDKNLIENKDILIALFLAIFVGWIVSSWGVPGLHPSVWSDSAVAAGFRPPDHLLPGLGIAVTKLIRTLCGEASWVFALRCLGHLTLALLALSVYLTFQMILSLMTPAASAPIHRHKNVMRVSAAVGTLAFVLSDPVWTAGQCLSGNIIQLTLTFWAIGAFLAMAHTGSAWMAALCASSFGLLSADTPFGFVLLGLFLGAYVYFERKTPPSAALYAKILRLEVRKWSITFLFFISFAGALSVIGWMYLRQNGFAANQQTTFGIPFILLSDYWRILSSAMSIGAGLLLIGTCLLPAIVSLCLFARATDEDKLLPYGVGLSFLVCGLIVLSQISGFADLCFWRHATINSSYLLSLGLACGSLTLALSLAVFGMDLFCREYDLIVSRLYGEVNLPNTNRRHPRQSMARSIFLMGALSAFVIAVILLCRQQKMTQRMQCVVLDAIRAIVVESEGLTHLVTGGHLDEAIELNSGGRLNCVPLIAPNTPRNAFLRTRGLTNDLESTYAFAKDAGLGLRTWIRDRPERLSQVGIMVGFDLWKREGKPLPVMGGFFARPCGYSTLKKRQAALAAARALAVRIEAIHADGIQSCTDESVREKFLAVQWRLAQMCDSRAEVEAFEGHLAETESETRWARRLNGHNPIYREIDGFIQMEKMAMVRKPTARESLAFALRNADFCAAEPFARIVLEGDAGDPDALFALAMRDVQRGCLARARASLLRCLSRRPEEPAVFNNLAMIEADLGLFDEAENHLRQALRLLPDSPAIRDTQRRLSAARRRRDRNERRESALPVCLKGV